MMSARPTRSAAMNANRHLRDSSSSPELSPPPPPKRARASKPRQAPRSSSRSSKSAGSKNKTMAGKAESEPIPEEPMQEIIEILDSEDEGGQVAEPAIEEIPEFVEDVPRLSGEMAFVKVRLDGGVDEDSSEDSRVWWPAGIVEHNNDESLDVFLLSAVCPGVSRRLTVPAALCDSVVRPMRSSAGVLFANVSSYRSDVDSNDLPASIVARLDAAFKRALEGMNAGDDDDELPTISSLLASTTNAVHHDQPLEVIPAEVWTAPGPERNLEIPGEPVLATEYKPNKICATTEFWAGRIDAYVPPPNSRTPPKYSVTFFEGTVRRLERAQFYTAAEDQFMTCLLGRFESNDTVNDLDEDSESPEPDSGPVVPIMPPPPQDKFDDLPMRQQVAYVAPILQAIINNEYEPARSFHEKFMRGGSARTKLKQESPAIGLMKETTVKKFWEHVDRWAAGLEPCVVAPDSPGRSTDAHSSPSPQLASREGSADTECLPDYPPSSLPSSSRRTFSTGSSVPNSEHHSATSLPSRPQGCDSYEYLTVDERREYCSLILHREAILQLLLWREGKRNTLQPGSPEVEAALRREAVGISKQGDILTLVMELRRQRLATHEPEPKPTYVAAAKSLTRTASGTRSRPRQGSFRKS